MTIFKVGSDQANAQAKPATWETDIVRSKPARITLAVLRIVMRAGFDRTMSVSQVAVLARAFAWSEPTVNVVMALPFDPEVY